MHKYLNVIIQHFYAPLFWFTLGVHYIAFYPGTLNGPLSIALPSPVSYIPVFSTQLSDHMNLWGRAKNLFYSFVAPVGKSRVTCCPVYRSGLL